MIETMGDNGKLDPTKLQAIDMRCGAYGGSTQASGTQYYSCQDLECYSTSTRHVTAK